MPASLRLAPLAAALALGLHGVAGAATIAVDDPGTGSVAGHCTLPDAVAALNSAAAVNACTAGNGNADTITLSAFHTATTITFDNATSADGKSALGFTRNARLVGPLGSDGKPLVTIARNTALGTPKFRVVGSTAPQLAVEGLAITGGDSADRGGGIAQIAPDTTYQYLRLVDSVVTGNNSSVSGGGVSFDCATVLIGGSTISGNSAQSNGGGIYSTSLQGVDVCYTTLAVQRSTVANNTAAGSGGGLFGFTGISDFVNTTLNGNSATVGGAIYTYGRLSLTNATVTGNLATLSNAAIYVDAYTYFLFSTIAGNICSVPDATGGVTARVMSVTASIIAGNSGTDLTVLQSSPTALSGSNDIIHGAPTPNTLTSLLDCDAKLGALAANGGPTQTLSLGTGSCALDAGPATLPIDSISELPVSTDQRGAQFLRKSGSATDIGAFESQPNERIFFDGFQRDYLSGVYFPNGLWAAPIIAGSGG